MSFDSDDALLEAHRLLVARGVIEPLASDDDDVQRWLDWELASLVEGHFLQVLDPASLDIAERKEWKRRAAAGGAGLRDPRRDEFRKVYWLLDGAERVGTLGIASRHFGGPHIGISSVYVRPDARRRGIAAHALDATFRALLDVGADGLLLDTNWCWQPAVRVE